MRIGCLYGKHSGEGRIYCSLACKQACPSYKQKTKWKSNKSATSREVNAYFRQLVLKKDNWTCQRCSKGTEAELHVHHIEGVTQNPHLANDLENGITLCKACHRFVHTQDGCKYHELRCAK
jgi:5-methylcytosine-specific restriction endonuclease McrA